MTTPRKPPTMADVARVAGVSPMTVSRAFKADSSMSEVTRAAIREANGIDPPAASRREMTREANQSPQQQGEPQ